MSAFTNQMYANAETTARGLVTGATDAPMQRSWREIHHQARRIAGALAQAGSPVAGGTNSRRGPLA
jgi:fatty-acyl-CoA synthase